MKHNTIFIIIVEYFQKSQSPKNILEKEGEAVIVKIIVVIAFVV